jgi:hypothetical protein
VEFPIIQGISIRDLAHELRLSEDLIRTVAERTAFVNGHDAVYSAPEVLTPDAAFSVRLTLARFTR